MKKPLVIGHRGAMGHAPENTLASFTLGWAMGADALECDVHLSRDRELVVMHDASLDRTSSGTGLIRDRPWRAITRFDAGGWYHRRFRGERVPRLPDLLRWMRDKAAPGGAPLRLVLELKNGPVPYVRLAEAVLRTLTREKFLDRTTVISFDHDVVKRVKRLCRRAMTGLLFHEPLPDPAARARWAGADALFPRRNLVTPALVRLARRHRLFLGVWTVNEPREMRRLARLGVDGIAGNYPDRLRKVLG